MSRALEEGDRGPRALVCSQCSTAQPRGPHGTAPGPSAWLLVGLLAPREGGVGGGAALSPPGGTDPSLPGPHPHFTCHRWTPNTAAVLARGPRGHSSAQSRRVTAASHQVENLGEKRWQGRTGRLSDWQWHWQCGLTGSGRELPSSRSSPDFHGPRPVAPPARGAAGPPCSLVPPFLPCSHLL